MKKIFAHPLFYYIFAVLGLGGMTLQFWYLRTGEDSKGLLDPWHPAIVITYLLLGLALVLTFLSYRHVHRPKVPARVRALGAGLAALLTAVSSGIFAYRQSYLLFILCVLATVSALYILQAHTKGNKPHYMAYSVFALCFMFYLISRYQACSAEPEIARYVFQILALVCMMMVFYQQAAIRAGTGRFRSYYFWRGMTLFLSLTAVPSAANPALYLAVALWLLVDPAPPAKPKDAKGSDAK